MSRFSLAPGRPYQVPSGRYYSFPSSSPADIPASVNPAVTALARCGQGAVTGANRITRGFTGTPSTLQRTDMKRDPVFPDHRALRYSRSMLPRLTSRAALLATALASPSCNSQIGSTPSPAHPVVVSIASVPHADAGDESPPPRAAPLSESCQTAIDQLKQSPTPKVALAPECVRGLAALPDLGFIQQLSIHEVYPGNTALDVSFLQTATALAKLELHIAACPSLESLEKLPALSELDWGCPGGIEGVRNLRHVSTLRVEYSANSGSRLDDVSVLGTLPNLKIFVTDRQVDIAAVATAVPDLEGLHARNSTATDALGRLQHLVSLTIGCFATSPTFAAPKTLENLTVDCDEVTASVWRSFSGIEELDISGRQIASLRGIEKLTALKKLDMHDTPIKSVAPLARVKTLESVDMHGSEVADLSPLAQLPHLKMIEAAPIPARSVASLAASKSIETLWLAGTPIANVRPLAALRSLKEVMLPRDCGRADAVALHNMRPDIVLNAWTEGPTSEDPRCY